MNLESLNWRTIVDLAYHSLKKKNLGNEYEERLEFEIREIEKQGAEDYWVRKVRAKEQFDHNKHGLVFPWLLGLTEIDPINHEWSYILDDDGDIQEEIITIIADGKEISIPSSCLIRTKRGEIKAADLQIGDELSCLK